MTKQPTFAEQEVLADSRRRARSRTTARELIGDLLLSPGFFAAAGAVWLIAPPHHVDVLTAGLCAAVLLLASQVLFETQFGFTVATQLSFVPMLFALPLAVVPLVFCAVMTATSLRAVLSAEARPSALLRVPGNSWSAIFPCLVLALAHVEPRHAGAPLLVAAFAAQFAGDFALSLGYFGIARGAGVREQLGDAWVYVIDAALTGVGVAVGKEMPGAPYAVLAVVPVLGLLWMFAHDRKARLDSLLELNDTYRGTALLLGDVISADDDYTGEHSQDVVALAMAVADRLGLDPDRRRNLEFGALLHDVGKIAIPKEILHKPGKLDPGEWEIMKTHAAEGQRMLSQVGGFMRDVGEIVRSHHERWDGGGYPDGLVGAAAPVESRIITCCDSWNAMRTDRPYREALSLEAALAELLANAGTQFDPGIAAALVDVVTSPAAGVEGDAAGGRRGAIRPLSPAIAG